MLSTVMLNVTMLNIIVSDVSQFLCYAGCCYFDMFNLDMLSTTSLSAVRSNVMILNVIASDVSTIFNVMLSIVI
jgi:hypothetical protein